MTKFLSENFDLINSTQVNQATYMKILANEALSIKNSINIANKCFGDVWKRDKKEQMKAAQTFQESCWEFFEPFTDQASINEYLNIQLQKYIAVYNKEKKNGKGMLVLPKPGDVLKRMLEVEPNIDAPDADEYSNIASIISPENSHVKQDD